MGLGEKVTKIEEAILIMKNLLVNPDERLEDYYKALRESREDFNFKMNALIDAQIKLGNAQAKNEAEIGELKEASKFQLNRIERLENK
jgi:hypothetical protein